MMPSDVNPEFPEGPPQPSDARDVFDGPFIPYQQPVQQTHPDNVIEGTLDIVNTPTATPPIPNSPQWDHDKAETIATALQTDPQTNGYFSHEEGTIGAAHTAALEESQKLNPTLLAESPEFSKDSLQQRFTSEVDKASQPFEVLYDTNPDLFVSMPTGEFVEKVKTLRDLEDGIQDAQVFIDHIEDYFTHEYLEKLTSGEDGIKNKDDIDQIIRSIGVDRLPQNDIQTINESIMPQLDSWEQPGKTVAEKLKELVLFVKDRQLKHRDSLIAQKEVFLNQYSPNNSQQPTTTYSQ